MKITMYDQVQKHRREKLEMSIKGLERLADANKERSQYLSEESFKFGLKFAIREIEEIELLLIKAQKETPFKYPEEAAREHKNQMITLRNIKSSLTRRYEGKP